MGSAAPRPRARTRICVSSPEAPEPDGSSRFYRIGARGAPARRITGSAAASFRLGSPRRMETKNCAKKAAAGESLSSADKEASSASPVGSSDTDEPSASQKRSAEEPWPSAGMSPESAGAGSGSNGSSRVTCALAEEWLGGSGGDLVPAYGLDVGESAGALHATSPTVPDAKVATGRTALITCHREASDAGAVHRAWRSASRNACGSGAQTT